MARLSPLCLCSLLVACTAELRNVGEDEADGGAETAADSAADAGQDIAPDAAAGDTPIDVPVQADLDAADVAADPTGSDGDTGPTDTGDPELQADPPQPDVSEEPPPEPSEMVLVPGGPFWWGCNSTVYCYPDEEPYRQISVSTFEIDRTEVTRAAYRACVEAGGCSALAEDVLTDRPEHPVAGVTWQQAYDYCAFRGKHLPTGAQWERAARGTQGAFYPWGDEPPTCELVNALACIGDTTPVGSYPAGATPEGAMDMIGNVWEWTADWYAETYYADAPDVDPPGPDSGPGRVYRGGAYPAEEERLDTWLRYFPDGTPGDGRRRERTGFRCAR